MDKPLKIGSMCTGYGGLDHALEMLYPGSTVTWCSEIDKAANHLIEKRYGYDNIGDLTKVEWEKIPKVDAITAGYPCQPFSVAGKRDLNDERIIWKYIFNSVIPLGRPELYLENVRGHLSRGFSGVLSDLASIGYSARWLCLPASSIGAPHRRERLFIHAYSDSSRSRKQQDTRRVRNLDIDSKHTTTRKEPKHRSAEIISNSERSYVEKHGLPSRQEQTTELRKPVSDFDWREYEPAIRRWETILNRPAPQPVKNNRLNPWFVEFMMGIDKGLVCGKDLELTLTQQLKLLGNGVVKHQAYEAYRKLLNER